MKGQQEELGSSFPYVHTYRLEIRNIINRPHLHAGSRLPHQKYEGWLLVHLKRRMLITHSRETWPSKQHAARSKKRRVHSCCFLFKAHLPNGAYRGGKACFYPNDNCCQTTSQPRMKSFPLCTESLESVPSSYFPRLTLLMAFLFPS